jgi:hypothetical protein
MGGWAQDLEYRIAEEALKAEESLVTRWMEPVPGSGKAAGEGVGAAVSWSRTTPRRSSTTAS